MGPSGVAICPSLLLRKCAHPIFVVRERIRDKGCLSYPSSSITGGLKILRSIRKEQASFRALPLHCFSHRVLPASVVVSIVFICTLELSDFNILLLLRQTALERAGLSEGEDGDTRLVSVQRAFSPTASVWDYVLKTIPNLNCIRIEYFLRQTIFCL